MKTFIEIHVLQNFAPSNLNRDDTGAPKDAFFGGTRRARVSSQCLKRAIREYFKVQNKDWVADRTKRVVDALVDRLSSVLKDHKDFSAENLLKAIEAAVNSLGGKKTVKVDKEKKTTDVLLFLSPKEIDSLAQVIKDSFADLLKAKLSESVIKSLNDAIDGENRSRLSVDVALFGRMLAVMPDKNQYAACHVAHAISTHSVEREFDFYTAVDDRKPEDTTGADMMGTIEFNSACFYRYAVVDWEKLVANLQGNTTLAENGLKAFLDGFVIAEPTGKQNSFAAHNPPEFISISVRRNTAPRNLANAFETPIYAKGKSLTKESADKLFAKAAALDKLYDTKANARFAVSEDVFDKAYKADGLGKQLESVPKLVEWAIDAVTKREE
ncbi:MAG: type I-E CRISPR-associated protein Cas7/Cse4/CasC [Pedobacter sp.]